MSAMDHLHASFLETLTSRGEGTSTAASMLSAFAAPARPGPVSASATRSAHARHGPLRWMSVHVAEQPEKDAAVVCRTRGLDG
jgi:hypothetical protein